MKKMLIFSTQLLSFIGSGLFIGWLLDQKFSLEGWGMIGGVILAYILWFVNFYKKTQPQKNHISESQKQKPSS